jgi:hypothetical protein
LSAGLIKLKAATPTGRQGNRATGLDGDIVRFHECSLAVLPQ